LDGSARADGWVSREAKPSAYPKSVCPKFIGRFRMTHSEVVGKFGHIPLKFRSYYKYTFIFTGEDKNCKICCRCGGDHSDIYRFEVTPDKAYYLEELSMETCTYIEITDKKTNEVIFRSIEY